MDRGGDIAITVRWVQTAITCWTSSDVDTLNRGKLGTRYGRFGAPRSIGV